jgi:hypothetical protein
MLCFPVGLENAESMGRGKAGSREDRYDTQHTEFLALSKLGWVRPYRLYMYRKK